MRAVHTVQLIFIMCIVCIVRPVLTDRIKPGFLLTGRSKHAAGRRVYNFISRFPGLKACKKGTRPGASICCAAPEKWVHDFAKILQSNKCCTR